MARPQGKAGIVSGGAQGIGAAICKRLAEEGAKVSIAVVVDGGGIMW